MLMMRAKFHSRQDSTFNLGHCSAMIVLLFTLLEQGILVYFGTALS